MQVTQLTEQPEAAPCCMHAGAACIRLKGSGPKCGTCCVLSITAPEETKGVFLHVQMEEEPWACLHWSRQELIRTDLMMGAYNAPVKLGSAPLWSLLLATQVISFHGNLIRGLSKVCFCIYNLLLVVSGFFLEAEAKMKNGARYIV